MSCSILDLGCHAAQVAADLWGGLSLPSKVLIALGLVLIVAGWVWTAAKLLKAVGGWPAVIGGAAVLAGLVIAVLPKTATPDAPRPAAKPEFQFGVDRVRPKKKQPMIFDRWRK